MSRAYCLTCNEQVTETPAGTCPSGHPVTTHDSGPEPWVGFVGDSPDAAARPAPPVEAERPAPRLTHVDPAGRPMAHAVNGAAAPAVNGHANGNGDGAGRALGGGHGASDPFPSTFGHRSSFATDESAAPTERAPASGQASDDLAALLAEALGGAGEDANTAEDGPGLFDHAPATESRHVEDTTPEPSRTEEWDDLASLAAELRLDADRQAEDVAPAADHAPAEAAVPPPPPPVESGDDLAAADLDALMAELTGDAQPAEDDTVEDAPPVAPPAAPASAAPPPRWDPTPLGDAPPPPEPVRSAPPALESTAPWDAPPAPPEDPANWDDPTPTAYDEVPDAPAPEVDAPVDLANFTASGRRVGQSGTDGGAKKKSIGRKKR